MLALWMFGAELERTWGTRRFVTFYFLCGMAASVTIVIAAYLFGGVNVPVVGSSGAVYGILVAYGVLFPNQTMLFGFLIPIKTKYFVMIIGAIVFLQSYMSIAAGIGRRRSVGTVWPGSCRLSLTSRPKASDSCGPALGFRLQRLETPPR